MAITRDTPDVLNACALDEEAPREADPSSHLTYEPSRHFVWPLVFLTIGLYLIASLGVKVWHLYAAVHTFEVTRGVVLDKDLVSLLAVAPDLDGATAVNTGDATGPDALPRSHDVAFAALGLVLVVLGAGSLTRRGRRLVATRSAARGRFKGFGRAVSDLWSLAETLLVGALVVLLLAFTYQVVIDLIGGARLSWDLIDRLIDDDIFRATASSW